MNRDRVNKTVLLALVFAVSLLFLWMIRDYLMALFMAALFSALLSPAYRALARRLGGREALASGIVVAAVLALIVAPLTALGGIVVGQAVSVGQSVTPWIQSFIAHPPALDQYLEKLPLYEQLLPYRAMIVEKLGQAVGNVSGFLINSLSSMSRMTLNALMGIVIMLYAMFFLLISGEALLRKILYFLPLCDADEQLLLRRFTLVTAATLKGTLIIGVAQGAICGAAFALAGIEGAVFWGAVMAVLSIIPALGTALVWGPALIILLLQGEYWGAFLLALLCGGAAGNIDNLLRPRLVGKGTQMHELFVLFGTLGGISLFGILGIIVGPIVAALFITLWELYGQAFADVLPEVGPLTPVLGKTVAAAEAAPPETAQQGETTEPALAAAGDEDDARQT